MGRRADHRSRVHRSTRWLTTPKVERQIPREQLNLKSFMQEERSRLQEVNWEEIFMEVPPGERKSLEKHLPGAYCKAL
jgi:hypothetical protein